MKDPQSAQNFCNICGNPIEFRMSETLGKTVPYHFEDECLPFGRPYYDLSYWQRQLMEVKHSPKALDRMIQRMQAAQRQMLEVRDRYSDWQS